VSGDRDFGGKFSNYYSHKVHLTQYAQTSEEKWMHKTKTDAAGLNKNYVQQFKWFWNFIYKKQTQEVIIVIVLLKRNSFGLYNGN
jgi:hypothetical protein